MSNLLECEMDKSEVFWLMESHFLALIDDSGMSAVVWGTGADDRSMGVVGKLELDAGIGV